MPDQMRDILWIFLFQFFLRWRDTVTSSHRLCAKQFIDIAVGGERENEFNQFMHFYDIQVLYSRIAIALWKSSRGIERHIQMQTTPSTVKTAGNTTVSPSNGANARNVNNIDAGGVGGGGNSKYEKRPVGVTDSQVRIFQRIFFSLSTVFTRIKLNLSQRGTWRTSLWTSRVAREGERMKKARKWTNNIHRSTPTTTTIHSKCLHVVAERK